MERISYKLLYILWGVMFVLTAALGFIPNPEGNLKLGLQLLAGVFFVPGWLILNRANKEGNVRHALTVRYLSLASLGATLVMMVLNLMSANWSETAGNILHAVLTIVSAPMVCGGTYLLGLFMWGCLLMGSMNAKR